MIRSIAKRMYTQVCTKNIEMVYPAYNELNMDIHRSIGEHRVIVMMDIVY